MLSTALAYELHALDMVNSRTLGKLGPLFHE